MIDVVFQFRGYDFSPLLSAYSVIHEVEVYNTVTTLNGTEHVAIRIRPTIQFRLRPLSDEETAAVYGALSGAIGEVYYTDPNVDEERYGQMYLTSSLESAFGLRSIDGNRYYKGNTITLRSRFVL